MRSVAGPARSARSGPTARMRPSRTATCVPVVRPAVKTGPLVKSFSAYAVATVAPRPSVVMLQLGPQILPRAGHLAADVDRGARLLVLDAGTVVQPGARL